MGLRVILKVVIAIAFVACWISQTGRASATMLYGVDNYLTVFAETVKTGKPCGYRPGPCLAVNTESYDSQEVQATHVGGSVNVTGGGSFGIWTFQTSAQESSTASLGELHLGAYAYGSGVADGLEEAGLSWFDTLTVVAPNLSPTTPIKFLAEMAPLGAIVETGECGSANTCTSNLDNVSSYFDFPGKTLSESICQAKGFYSCGFGTSPHASEKESIFTVYPGETFTISGNLDLLGTALGSQQADCTDSGQCSYYNLTATTDTLFQDTVSYYVQPLTPGVSYTTASGMSYLPPSSLTATPEPSTCALFGTGILLMGVMAYRRKKVAA